MFTAAGHTEANWMSGKSSVVRVILFTSIVAHETGHWTKHPSRLDRALGRKKCGDAGYAMEEMVAELTAAMTCADLGITPVIRDDHAQYIGHWLKVLDGDPKAVFTAAALAQKATEYMHAKQPGYVAHQHEDEQPSHAARLQEERAAQHARSL